MRAASRVIHPPTLVERATQLRAVLVADDLEVHLIEVPDGEAAKTADVLARLLGRARRRRVHPVRRRHRPGRRSDDRPRRLRRGELAARRAVRQPADDRARHGRRRGRRQDRHQHRLGQEPGRRVPRARRGALRPRRPRIPVVGRAAQRDGRGREVRVHRRPDDPRADRGGTRQRAGPGVAPCSRSSSPRASRSRRPWSRRPARDGCGRGHRSRGTQLRPHARPRARARPRLPPAPRRGDLHRHGVRRRARPPQRPHRRRPAGPPPVDPRPPRAADDERHGLRRPARGDAPGQEDPRHQLRFVVLDGLARPAIFAGPDEDLLRQAHEALRP